METLTELRSQNTNTQLKERIAHVLTLINKYLDQNHIKTAPELRRHNMLFFANLQEALKPLSYNSAVMRLLTI